MQFIFKNRFLFRSLNHPFYLVLISTVLYKLRHKRFDFRNITVLIYISSKIFKLVLLLSEHFFQYHNLSKVIKHRQISRTCLRKHSECKPYKTLHINIHNAVPRTYLYHIFLCLHGKLLRHYHNIILFRIVHSLLHNLVLQKISLTSARTAKNKLNCHPVILSPV